MSTDSNTINHIELLSRIRTSYISDNASLFSLEKVESQFELFELLIHLYDEKNELLKYLYDDKNIANTANFGSANTANKIEIIDRIKIKNKLIERVKEPLTNQNKNVKLLQGKLNSKKYFAHSTDIFSGIHKGISKDFNIKDSLTDKQLSESQKNPKSKTFCLMEAKLFKDIVFNKKLIKNTKVICGSRSIASGKLFLKMCEERNINFGSFNYGLIKKILTKLAMIAHDHDIILNESSNVKNKNEIIKVYTNKYNKYELCSLGKNYKDHTSNMETLCKDIISDFLDICMKYKEKSLIKTSLNTSVKKIHAWSTYCETYAHKDSEKFKEAFNNFL